MSLWSLLGFAGAAPEEGPAADAIGHVAAALQRLPAERARYLAGFAYLLSRVARADHHVSDEETAEMERIVADHGVDAGEARLVVEMARSQNELFGATEDFVVARELQQLSSREQKLQLVDCLFAVSAADQTISTVEDNEIRRICSELRLTHADFISVRSGYRQYLGVLKSDDPA